MFIYYFLLGNTPKLSLYELKALLKKTLGQNWEEIPKVSLKQITETLVRLETPEEISVQDIQTPAGGIVKIYQEIASFHPLDQEEIKNTILEHLMVFAKEHSLDKLTFGLSDLSSLEESPLPKLSIIKKALKDSGVSSRYIEAKDKGLTAAVLTHHQVEELVLLNTESADQIALAKTASIQDIDDWSKRDRQKPYADRKKGMLPPKVARIMLNLALSHLEQKENGPLSLYDPFCGSGTVLMEGLLLGHQVWGSDLDPAAISGANKNLTWLEKEYSLENAQFEIFKQDAGQKITHLAPNSIQMIVTEPFLGKPKPKPEQLKNIFTGLERMYLGALKKWKSVLKDGGVVVMVFPLVETKQKTYHLKNLIDKLSSLGYTTVSKSIIYGREKAVVKRQLQIMKLDKNTK